MVNTQDIEMYIAMSGMKKCHIASSMGITRQSLMKKVNNQIDFKSDEIEKLCEILRIPKNKWVSIFFA